MPDNREKKQLYIGMWTKVLNGETILSGTFSETDLKELSNLGGPFFVDLYSNAERKKSGTVSEKFPDYSICFKVRQTTQKTSVKQEDVSSLPF